MGMFFKYLLYFILGLIVFRYLKRMFSPKPTRPNPSSSDFSQKESTVGSLDEPKFTIEAESVDYEIIEDPQDPNEK